MTVKVLFVVLWIVTSLLVWVVTNFSEKSAASVFRVEVAVPLKHW